VDSKGDGAGPEILLNMFRLVTDMDKVVDFVYPLHILAQPKECLKRAILALTNRQVDAYNDTILKRVHGMQRTYVFGSQLSEGS
jgi:ATP-dependent DNA helicase PIF1